MYLFHKNGINNVLHLSCSIFKARKFGIGFFGGLIFGPGIFGGLVGSPWDIWVLIFAPIRSSPSLE